jgi:hypothetical protein
LLKIVLVALIIAFLLFLSYYFKDFFTDLYGSAQASSGDRKGTWNQLPYHSPSKPYKLHFDFKIPDTGNKKLNK